jgi:hypothetical protein
LSREKGSPNPYLEKLRSIGFMSKSSKPKVKEGWVDGHRIKSKTDELGTVTEHNTKDDRVDVRVTPPHIKLAGAAKEIRNG